MGVVHTTDVFIDTLCRPLKPGTDQMCTKYCYVSRTVPVCLSPLSLPLRRARVLSLLLFKLLVLQRLLQCCSPARS